ncbi:MSMEG_1061 family FMN-dependent PPOX-type flavoprotein [Fulvimarina sp. MAC8]|uniref:MSMEG_1061 family FMN-dependent PPOX-type flavoprotein n=1 Tax=Fulvimarina sp. MAC8 TaxID=3162874 RepID=UPI0032EF7E9C
MTPDKLRELYGDVSPRAAAKVITAFDAHCRSFVERATFLVLATSDGTNLDTSPKGDPAGFVEIESDTTMQIPDRPGNNRIDGLLNILAHPKVAVVLMIQTVSEMMRVNGLAEILDDPDIRERFSVRGRPPKTVLRITAEEIFIHCGKAPMRAGLWNPESWPQSRPVATLNEIIRDHSRVSVESVEQSDVEAGYRKTLC